MKKKFLGAVLIKNPILQCQLCFVRATFVKKNSCLVARIVSFETVALHLLTLRILEPYLSKDRTLKLMVLL